MLQNQASTSSAVDQTGKGAPEEVKWYNVCFRGRQLHTDAPSVHDAAVGQGVHQRRHRMWQKSGAVPPDDMIQRGPAGGGSCNAADVLVMEQVFQVCQDILYAWVYQMITACQCIASKGFVCDVGFLLGWCCSMRICGKMYCLRNKEERRC